MKASLIDLLYFKKLVLHVSQVIDLPFLILGAGPIGILAAQCAAAEGIFISRRDFFSSFSEENLLMLHHLYSIFLFSKDCEMHRCLSDVGIALLQIQLFV